MSDTLGETPDFVGDNRETATLLAGSCRLDCRVERQEVGLSGDVIDDRDDLTDLLGLRAELCDLLRCRVDRCRDTLHALDRLIDHCGSVVGRLGSFFRTLCRALCGGCDL